MMLRPRNYGSINRVIAKAVSHSVNDYYRQKKRADKYKQYNNINANVNNTVKMPKVNNIDDSLTYLFLVVMIGLVILPFIFPSILILYVIIFILMLICS